MKLLINDKEIIEFLEYLSRTGLSEDEKEKINSIHLEETHVAEVVYSIIEKKQSGKIKKFLRKIPGKIENAVKEDLKIYVEKIKEIINDGRLKRQTAIRNKFPLIVKKLGEQNIFNAYKKSNNINGFVKTVGLQIDNNASMIFRSKIEDFTEDCLLRNTNGSEKLLVSKIDNNYPFWFIDSGYTNFLEGKNKVWHRLTRNHIHQLNYFEAPVDRLGNFKEFPKQWRQDGEFILVIEPGPFSAAIFHVDLKTWKYEIEKELRKYTDKPIKFRPKINKKIRDPLYKELLNEDYYCLININSNAATESIWAGVPIITLDKHISNPISRNNLSDINSLVRPNLANWLCMLSYSQFTYDELINGTAIDIIRKYHVHN